MNAPEMVDSVNAIILFDRRDTIKDTSGNFLGTTQKIVHDDFSFSKVSCHRISQGQCKTSYCCKNS